MEIIIITPFKENSTKVGEARYSTELIKHLKKLTGYNFSFKVISPKKKLNFFQWVFYDIFILPFLLLKTNADIYHATSPGEIIAPILLRKRSIVTLQDVIYLTYPDGINFLRILYFNICTFFIKKADLVITSSEFSKHEIIQTLKISPNKIKKIYLGIDSEFKKFDIKKNNNKIGYLGGQKGRKNVESLIRAFKILQQDSKHSNYKLLLSFKPNNSILELVKSLKIKNIDFLNGIPENKIVNFYNSLDVFVFPSLYEGFGFPPLEAMRCGCPIICSNSTSVAEVTGSATIKVNTLKPSEIAKSIKKILENENIRKSLIVRGIKKSREYTWEKTAISTLNVYKSLK